MTDQKKTPSGGNREGAKQYRHTHLTNSSLFLQDIVAAFKAALDSAGLFTKDKITTDGKLHRFTVQGDRPGSKNGWYVLFDGPVPAGAFGSWKTGQKHTWCGKAENTLTPFQRAEFRRCMDTARKAREAEEQAQRKAARDKAQATWQSSIPATPDHPYLVRKKIGIYGIRQNCGVLVIPLRDTAGTLHSLQFITADGEKRFLSGGRIKGCCFMIGTPGPVVCIAEGYATAASIHEATGYAVAVAFNCGNLKAVALAVRDQYPQVKITLCADNDEKTPGNPGLTKAREATAACGGFLAIPPIAGDFNDLMTGGVI